MAVYENASEITVEMMNLSDASARTAASKSHRDEDGTTVPGGKVLRCVAVSFCLLCVLQVALHISLRLALSPPPGIDASIKSLTEERDELRSINLRIEESYKTLTEERDELKRKLSNFALWKAISSFKSLTEERDELRSINLRIEESYKNLTEERDELKRKLSNFASQQSSLTEERDELKRKLNDLAVQQRSLAGEGDKLKRKLNDCASQQNSLTTERDGLKRKLNDFASQQSSLTEERDELKRKLNDCAIQQSSLAGEGHKLKRMLNYCASRQNSLTTERDGLKRTLNDFVPARWMYFRGSFYHISSDQNTWQESRRDCQQKDADLVIINSKEEQDFTRQFKKYMWIGLTDLQTEGTWKWVDGTPVTKSYWGPKEPNGGSGENCGEMKFDSENSWNDGSCSLSHFWMCEKKVRP